VLAPRDRRLLLETLRPPAGYQLDRAIGTTYSLDLLALLTVPLAFTFLDWEDEQGDATGDPLALLEASRRHAEKITIFCEAGRILVPTHRQPLLGYLERCVVEVAAPGVGGTFHPKLWVLRFRSDDAPVRYRVLCLSRNLTFDRSWDTALVLDGVLTDRTNAFSRNHPLGDFLVELPRLARRDLPPGALDNLQGVAEEIRRVDFELPDGVEKIAFWPLGIEGHQRFPFADVGRRMLIVSPFLSEGLLKRMAADHPESVLVSRPESLQAVSPDTLRAFEQVLAMNPDLETDNDEETSDVGSSSGLHAKLYVADDGWNARVWTGSANATQSAFSRNVEFLVELVGKKSRLGIDAILGDSDELASAMRDLLEEFRPTEDGVVTSNPLEDKLEEIRRELSRAPLHAEVIASGEDTFSLVVVPDSPLPEWSQSASVACRPATLRSESVRPVLRGSAEAIAFSPLSFDALTSFFVFEVTIADGKETAASAFTVNLPLLGAPADRRERLLRSLLKDRDQVLRLLLLLLAEEELSVADLVEATQATWGVTRASPPALDLLPLLEPLLRALARDPRRLDPVARLVDDLRRSPEGAALLPEGLEAIWSPILAVRRERRA